MFRSRYIVIFILILLAISASAYAYTSGVFPFSSERPEEKTQEKARASARLFRALSPQQGTAIDRDNFTLRGETKQWVTHIQWSVVNPNTSDSAARGVHQLSHKSNAAQLWRPFSFSIDIPATYTPPGFILELQPSGESGHTTARSFVLLYNIAR